MCVSLSNILSLLLSWKLYTIYSDPSCFPFLPVPSPTLPKNEEKQTNKNTSSPIWIAHRAIESLECDQNPKNQPLKDKWAPCYPASGPPSPWPEAINYKELQRLPGFLSGLFFFGGGAITEAFNVSHSQPEFLFLVSLVSAFVSLFVLK